MALPAAEALQGPRGRAPPTLLLFFPPTYRGPSPTWEESPLTEPQSAVFQGVTYLAVLGDQQGQQGLEMGSGKKRLNHTSRSQEELKKGEVPGSTGNPSKVWPSGPEGVACLF